MSTEQSMQAHIGKISSLLNSKDGDERCLGLSLIATTQEPNHLEAVTEMMLTDSVVRVREMAAFALDNLSEPETIPALVKAIHDPAFGVRSAAGWALVHLSGDVVRQEMQTILRNATNQDAEQMANLVLARL